MYPVSTLQKKHRAFYLHWKNDPDDQIYSHSLSMKTSIAS